MPRILSVAAARPDIREAIAATIKKLKPGQCVLVNELAEEIGCCAEAVRNKIPAANRSKMWLPGKTKASCVIICPEPTKSKAKASRN